MKKIIFLVCIMSVACNDGKRKNSAERHTITNLGVNPLNATKVTLSNIFDKTHFIKLESTDESLLGEVSKILYMKNKFFIGSQGKKEAVLVFNSNGDFITSVGKNGVGPGEYLHLQDFHIDTLSNSIEIMDSEGRKIIYYDGGGKYLNYWNTNLFSLAFLKMDGDTYAFYCGNDLSENNANKLKIISKSKDKVIAQHFPIQLNQAKYLNLYDLTNFSKYNNELSFLYGFNDTIFSFSGERIEPRLHVDFGHKELPKEFLEKNYDNVMEFLQAVGKTSYAYRIMGFFETDNLIVFGFRYLDKVLHAYYIKSSGEVIVVDKLIDDMSFNSFETATTFDNLPKGSTKNSLLYVVEPTDFISTVDSIKSSLSEKEWKTYQNENVDVVKIYENSSIDDNPIIAVRQL